MGVAHQLDRMGGPFLENTAGDLKCMISDRHRELRDCPGRMYDAVPISMGGRRRPALSRNPGPVP